MGRRQLDGTERVPDPTVALSSADPARLRRPAPVPPVLVDARVLVVAALIASPAAYRATQGLLSPTEAMTRYLVVAAGCVLVSLVVRSLWPVIAGEAAASGTTARAPGPPGSTTTAGRAATGPAGVVLADGAEPLDPLDSLTDLGALDSLDSFDELDALELSTE